jgi:hypothetical protein
MAEKADAVSTLQDITEDEFRQAYKTPNKIVRNPGKVFEVGNVSYSDNGTSGHPSFEKITHHEDKTHEFLHWYNAEDGGPKMFFAGNECFSDLSKLVRESKDPGEQQSLQMKSFLIVSEIESANAIAKGASDEMIQRGFQLISGYSLEIDRMKDRYNKLVENVTAYDEAVNEYIKLTNHIFATNRISPPPNTLAPVRVAPITCTGNTLAFGQATTYPNSADMIVSGTTTVHCD